MQMAVTPMHFGDERKDILGRLERQMRGWNGLGRVPTATRCHHHLYQTCLGRSLAPVGQFECQVVVDGAEAADEEEAIPDSTLEFVHA